MAALDRLQGVFRDVFDDDSIVLSAATTADDIDEWDSLTHVELVLEVEREFGVRFSTAEIQALMNVGDFARLIESKLC